MNAVISVVGKDAVGIIAKVSAVCAEHNANILDITQKVIHDYFTMIMIVEIDALNIPFSDFIDRMELFGKENALDVRTMHEDIFNAMHRI